MAGEEPTPKGRRFPMKKKLTVRKLESVKASASLACGAQPA